MVLKNTGFETWKPEPGKKRIKDEQPTWHRISANFYLAFRGCGKRFDPDDLASPRLFLV
jgi:hypothetical protein